MLSIEIEDSKVVHQLKKAARSHEKSYIRERSSAILKVWRGENPTQVARDKLLYPRHPQTVRSWVHAFKTEGFKGLFMKPGRGRKPAYSPKKKSGSEAKSPSNLIT